MIRGAREHNLKNLNLEIPRDQLVVITGLSGSGKSSLAFDTIYAEGQRRYVESLSAYARQFLEQLGKPDVDSIEGLSPAIAIEQKNTSRNPRSTVGTVTEIYDYLRVLFARVGHPFCVHCGEEIRAQTVQQMADAVCALPEGTKFQVLAPIVRGRKGEYRKELLAMRRAGYVRARIDGQIVDLSHDIALNKQKKHTIEIVVDRLVMKSGEVFARRLADSVGTTTALTGGLLGVLTESGTAFLYSEHLACIRCGLSFPEQTPRVFSFNSPYGACAHCDGIGYAVSSSETEDPDLSHDIALNKQKKHTIEIVVDRLVMKSGEVFARRLADSVGTTTALTGGLLGVLTESGTAFLYSEHLACIRCGLSFPEQTPRVFSFNSPYGACAHCDGIGYAVSSSETEDPDLTVLERCHVCQGARLKRESLSVKVADHSIAQVAELSVRAASEFFSTLQLTPREAMIAQRILKEIRERLGFLVNVGLDYLGLDRPASTLSGGEGQRIRLATQIGSGLVGVLYILDEPSIGLHPRDNRRLLHTLLQLRNMGNSVLVVEHDAETMISADHLLDLGPGAGTHGGQVVAQGTPKEVMAQSNSLTGQYLRGILKVTLPNRDRRPKRVLTVVGATKHNLKNLTVRIPLGLLTCVTGVSGSGKSTLVLEVLCHSLSQLLYHQKPKIDGCRELKGTEALDKVINIDQSPIGRTPRSNPATYTGLFASIRDLFSNLPESRVRGYTPGRYSFNVKGGRCESCQGDGLITIEMHFLPDVYVTCEVCNGQRYNRETLEVRHKDRSIADILKMTVDEALDFFHPIPFIKAKLQTLHDVGLHYVTLGQSATTLSGGEAQRVKLSRELSKRATGRTMYLLDEPTTGLHFADIQQLLNVLNRLVESGNTVLVIEHNVDVIKNADWIIDLGPEGGEAGGELVAEGTPSDVAQVQQSYTGDVLQDLLPSSLPGPPHKTNTSDGARL